MVIGAASLARPNWMVYDTIRLACPAIRRSDLNRFRARNCDSSMSDLPWLGAYSGQSVQELLLLRGTYRDDSILVALDMGLQQKCVREERRASTEAETNVLALVAFENEVMNGGLWQFLANSSREFADRICSALALIGASEKAEVVRRAFAAVGLDEQPSVSLVAAVVGDEGDFETQEARRAGLVQILEPFDDRLMESGPGLAELLLDYVRTHESHFHL